jgi:hypothetical protein
MPFLQKALLGLETLSRKMAKEKFVVKKPPSRPFPLKLVLFSIIRERELERRETRDSERDTHADTHTHTQRERETVCYCAFCESYKRERERD